MSISAEKKAERTSSDSPEQTNDLENSEQQRDGSAYLVGWDGNEDPLDPRSFSPTRKWLYVAIVSMGSLLVTCTSSLYTLTYDQIAAEFDASIELCNLGLSLYLIGLALGPLLFGPLSEFYGRRPIYITSTFFFLVWLIPCAVAKNIQTMLVARFLNGLSGSAFLSVAAGTIVDMFLPKDLLIPMTVFTGSPFVGPALGPIMGGFICSFADWRWCFYVQIIWALFILITVILVPETFHPVLLARKAAKVRKSSGDHHYYSASEQALAGKSLRLALLTSLYVPFKLLLQDPMIAVLSAYCSLLQAILYMCFSAFPLVFGVNHSFNLWQIGLTFVGLLIGNVIACVCNPLWHKQWMSSIAKMKVAHGASYQPQPELRLLPSMAGGPMLTVALFWFAWTTYPSIPWAVPIVATIFFSMAFFLLFQGMWTFLTAAYPQYAASVMAVNTTTRCLLAAAFPLFTPQMYNSLGYQWASSLVAFLTLVMAPFPFIFYKYGPILRARSKFAKG